MSTPLCSLSPPSTVGRYYKLSVLFVTIYVFFFIGWGFNYPTILNSFRNSFSNYASSEINTQLEKVGSLSKVVLQIEFTISKFLVLSTVRIERKERERD